MNRLEYKWKVLISVIFGIFMVILDSTVVNVAFPTLRAEFNASVNDSQWIISVYVMSLGISTPVSAFLGERFGMKKIYVSGIALFVVGSFLCGIAPNFGPLDWCARYSGLWRRPGITAGHRVTLWRIYGW